MGQDVGREQPWLSRWLIFITPPPSPSAAGSRRREAQVRSGLALAPDFTIRFYREDTLSDNPTYLAERERILEGLRLAGAPEG